MDRLAENEFIAFGFSLLQNSSEHHRGCLWSLFRALAILEMTGRIPEWKSLDVPSLLAAARKEGQQWIPEMLRANPRWLEGAVCPHPKDECGNRCNCLKGVRDALGVQGGDSEAV